MTLGELLNCSVTLQNWDDGVDVTGLLWGLFVLIYGKNCAGT